MEPTTDSAQCNAGSSYDRAGSSPSIRVCLLPIGRDYLAVDFSQMREVFKVESITPVPGTPPVLVGVANLRGSVIPVVDVRPLVGLPCRERPMYAAVVCQEGVSLGVLIDGIPHIDAVPQGETPDPLPDEPGNNYPVLAGRVRTESGVCPLLDVGKLLAALDSVVDAAA